MNPLTNGIRDVLFRMPREILQLAFIDRRDRAVRKIESQIMSLVVKPRVMKDLNLQSSNTMYVSLSDAKVLSKDEFGTVIEIPKKKISGKTIIEAMAIADKIPVNTVAALGGEANMGDALKPVPYIEVHTSLQLIAENVIYIHGDVLLLGNKYLKCAVAYNESLSELPKGAYEYISKLITLAVQAYIYNTLIIKLDMGYIYQGSELEVVKRLVEQFETKGDEYDEELKLVTSKVLFMSDAPSMGDFVSKMLPGEM